MSSSLVWHVFPTAADVAEAAAAVVTEVARDALAARGEFRIVLAGGRTPIDAYRLLRTIETDWAKWEFFFGDERCLPEIDPERNSRMISDAWLSAVRVQRERVHLVPVELGAEAAAARYAALIAQFVPFDLVVLGLGEDGHTASLFPGDKLDETAWCIPVLNAPKPPAMRVSLGLHALRATREVLVIATGTAKQTAIRDWRTGRTLPIQQATVGLRGRVQIDIAANG